MSSQSHSSFPSGGGQHENNAANLSGINKGNNDTKVRNDVRSNYNLGMNNFTGGPPSMKPQTQVTTPKNSDSNDPNAHMVEHFLSILKSSMDMNGNSKMSNLNGATNFSGPPITVSDPGVKVHNTNNSKGNLNSVGSGITSSNGNTANNKKVSHNFTMNTNPNVFRHLPPDITAALLMNPQAAAHAGVTAQQAQAAMASLLAAQAQAQAQAQPPPQPHSQQPPKPQPHSQHQHPPKPHSQHQDQQRRVSTSNNGSISGMSQPHEVKTNLTVNVNASAPPNYSLNNMNKNKALVPVTENMNNNSSISNEDNGNRNINTNVNLQLGAHQVLAILSSAGLINTATMNQLLVPANTSVNPTPSAYTTNSKPSPPVPSHDNNRNNNNMNSIHNRNVKQALAILSSAGLINNNKMNQSNISTAPTVSPLPTPTPPIPSNDNNNSSNSNVNPNVNPNMNANNGQGINQLMALLSSSGIINNNPANSVNQATLQAIVTAAAAAASGVNVNIHSPHAPQPPPPPNSHSVAHCHPAPPQVGPGSNTQPNIHNRNIMTNVPPPLSAMPPPTDNMMQMPPMLKSAPPPMRSLGKKPHLITSTLENMRNWSLHQLEAHVRHLRETNQTISQPLSLLLADARRKEEKRTAKRLANRKSACTSRARKKALVEEMARTNAKLKRQALILSLLPDLVMAITVKGEITFCSAQVERVLKHKVDDLVGSNLSDILLPVSKEALRQLIANFVKAGNNEQNAQNNRNKTTGNNGGSSLSESSNVAIVSEQSFPLSVVKVMGPGKNPSPNSKTNNGSSGGEAGKNTSSFSSLGSSSSRSGSEEDQATKENTKRKVNKISESDEPSSVSQAGGNICDDAFSDEAKMRASETLNRNVQNHKDQLCKEKLERNVEHKDDVTGASVTSNNADARLSSLQHRPKNGKASLIKPLEKNIGIKKNLMVFENLEAQSSSSDSLSGEEKPATKTPATVTQQAAGTSNENMSDDSGYRVGSESPPSREDSSADDSSDRRRSKPLAPTCNICVIREDLTTIWCEVTSSVRTKLVVDEMNESTLPDSVSKTALPSTVTEQTLTNDSTDNKAESSQEESVKELLLCFRPINEGQEKVSEEFRFKPKAAHSNSETEKQANNKTMNSVQQRPVKKRPFDNITSSKAMLTTENQDIEKRKKISSRKANGQTLGPNVTTAKEKSVVESLILMSHKQKRKDK